MICERDQGTVWSFGLVLVGEPPGSESIHGQAVEGDPNGPNWGDNLRTMLGLW
jgi:hypothetical protein